VQKRQADQRKTLGLGALGDGGPQRRERAEEGSTLAVGENPDGLTRRGVISRAALLGASAGLGGLLATDAGAATAAAAVPFYGPHQAGIATAAQDCMYFAAFDLAREDPRELRELLERWTTVAHALTAGRPYQPVAQQLTQPPLDTGEAIGLAPARLTLTFGFGPSLFDTPAAGRLGLARKRPTELRALPRFRGERLDPASSGGDLCVQACADDPQVAFHAVHELTRVAAGAVLPRFSQQGFGRTSSTTRTQATQRNLLGFKDGTDNLRAEDTSDLEEFVWVPPGDGPRWMADGTYLIARRIRMLFDRWDATSLEDQQRTIGREKLSGAPLGERSEYDPLDLQARAADGELAIPASPQSNAGQAILRRGYSYSEGVDAASGEIDAGLFFVCFQRSPTRQFIPLLRRLSQSDALNRFTVHTSSSIFACPPGILPDSFVGELLFE
jgi:deferrochelatase/peroxidase EfeB